MARQLNRVAKDRDGFGNDYLRASYSMLLRIAAKLGPVALKTRGLKKAYPALQTFETLADGWSDPPLSLQWGAWFQPNAQDDKDLVETTNSAYDGGWITRKTGVEKLKRTFGIENVDAYLESLEEESAEREAKEAEDLAASVSKMHAGLTNDPNARGRGKNPAANAQGRSGGAASATGNAAKANSKQPSRESKD